MDNLVAKGELNQNLFGFYLTRGQSTGSELSIGALDNNHFSGSITYTPVVSESYVRSSDESFLFSDNFFSGKWKRPHQSFKENR